MKMITALFGYDGKFHTYTARGVVGYSLEDLAEKLGVPVSDLSVQIDMDAHTCAKLKPKAKIAPGVENFDY